MKNGDTAEPFKKYRSVSLWVGCPESSAKLADDIAEICESLGPSEARSSPQVLFEESAVPTQEVIESFDHSERFLDNALRAAKRNRIFMSTAGIAIYWLSEPKIISATLRDSAMFYLGAFPIEHIEEPEISELENDWQPVHLAAKRNDAKLLEQLLKSGYSVDRQNDANETPLYCASRDGLLEIVRILVEHGANLETANEVGHTPLMVACAAEHPEIVRILLSNGASVFAETFENGYTPLHWAVMHPLLDEKKAAEIVRLLVTSGAEINHVGREGITPLMQAAWFDSGEIVALLLSFGAEAEISDDTGRTALSMAKAKGHSHVVEILTQQTGPNRKDVSKSLANRLLGRIFDRNKKKHH